MTDIQAENSLLTEEFLKRWSNAEYVLLLKARATDTAQSKVGNSKNWDVVITSDVLRLDSQKVTTLKADLVTDGILTQARADEIFGPSTG
jgi:hypothetical protein